MPNSTSITNALFMFFLTCLALSETIKILPLNAETAASVTLVVSSIFAYAGLKERNEFILILVLKESEIVTRMCFSNIKYTTEGVIAIIGTVIIITCLFMQIHVLCVFSSFCSIFDIDNYEIYEKINSLELRLEDIVRDI